MIRCRRAARVAVVRRDDRTFVASLHGEVVMLRDNAVVIWECVDTGYCEIANIVDRVAARAGLPATEVAAETRAFLDSLRESELIIAE